MQLKEFVNSRVETVEPGDTLQRAAEKMRGLDVRSLPVCDNGQLVGVITDRDITIRADLFPLNESIVAPRSH